MNDCHSQIAPAKNRNLFFKEAFKATKADCHLISQLVAGFRCKK
jgi:hypothetical protein